MLAHACLHKPCSRTLAGLLKWIDTAADAANEGTSMTFAMFRGLLRFLFWSTVGAVTSRLFCEFILSMYVVRDALLFKLRGPEHMSPLVKPVGPVADASGYVEQGFSMAMGASSSGGYQTVQ